MSFAPKGPSFRGPGGGGGGGTAGRGGANPGFKGGAGKPGLKARVKPAKVKPWKASSSIRRAKGVVLQEEAIGLGCHLALGHGAAHSLAEGARLGGNSRMPLLSVAGAAPAAAGELAPVAVGLSRRSQRAGSFEIPTATAAADAMERRLHSLNIAQLWPLEALRPCSPRSSEASPTDSSAMDVDDWPLSPKTPPASSLATIAWEELEIESRLGQGGYGEVYAATWNGARVAVKVPLCGLSGLRTTGLEGIGAAGGSEEECKASEELVIEAELMHKLSHRNIVACYGRVERPLAMVCQLVDPGSLRKLLDARGRPSLSAALKVAVGVCRAMEHLHGQSPPIVHRDLTSSNVLVDKKWTAYVNDFGLSRARTGSRIAESDSLGCVGWAAPEVVSGAGAVTEKADVYSFGVILWELMTGKVPWAGMHTFRILYEVANNDGRPPIPDDCPPGVAGVLRACWDREASARPAFPWLRSELERLRREARAAVAGTPSLAVAVAF